MPIPVKNAIVAAIAPRGVRRMACTLMMLCFLAVSADSSRAESMEVQCRPTAPDSLGPFYKPGAPERESVGSGYLLTGVVLSAQTCLPIPGARVEFWMNGPNGEYDDAFRATVFSKQDGAYRFESHHPKDYFGRPPHIHIRVSADGFNTLVTQHYPSVQTSQGDLDLVVLPQP